ncbi:MAG: CotS family spore coat protein [Clostridiales bacterium]|nr:CotS family spore coat protein [Clostridiales bacterium]
MYIRPEQVLEQYDFEVKAVQKGRDGYLCDTSRGTLVLKEYRGSKERAEFLAGMLTHLRSEHILVETVIRTKEGEPLAVSEDESKYMVKAAFCGTECDTKSRDSMLAGAGALAKLHHAACSYEGEVPEFVKVGENELLYLYEKHNRELRKVKNYIRGKKKKNEFEVMFADHYARFMEKAEAVTIRLSEAGEQGRVGFCHGDYNQHNVIFSMQEIAVVHFDNFSYQIQVGDLANFMRKMLEKNGWNTGLGTDLIAAYDKVRRLSKQELECLYSYLAYPEKFWKIANRYYNTHKAWLSGRSIEKLEKLIRQEEQKEQFLQMLFHFTT